MTVLEAARQANKDAGIRTLSFANIQEFQAFMGSFTFNEYPANVLLPFTSNGVTENQIRKATIPLQGWVVTKVEIDPNNYRTEEVEAQYLEPMRNLAIKFIKNLLDSDIINPQAGPVRDTINPEYMFLNERVFGVSYKLDLPVVQNVC